MDKQKLINGAKAQIAFYENLLDNFHDEMSQEDLDRYLDLLSKNYALIRTLESEL